MTTSNEQPQVDRSDPFIEEVRELKRAALARFDHDLERLQQHLRDIEDANRDRVVDLSRREDPHRGEVA